MQSAICSLQSVVCRLQSAVCSLQSAVCSLQMSDTVFISNPSTVDHIALKRHELKLTVCAFVFCIYAVRIYRAMKARGIISLRYRHKETL